MKWNEILIQKDNEMKQNFKFPTAAKVTADLVTFTEEILNGKPHFLCSVF